MGYPFHIVDVFAEERFAGNQLAVVLDTDDLTTEKMQSIALETNFSETTFLRRLEGMADPVPVRIFTPTVELPFAGHPTLGTAWVIREESGEVNAEAVTLSLGVGEVPVRFEMDGSGNEILWLAAPEIQLGKTAKAEEMAEVLGIGPDDLDDRGPVQHISAGIEIVTVPLRSLDALRRCWLDLGAYATLREQGFPPYVHVFSTEPNDPANHLSARFFFEVGGVREDPATGSATACLGAYLLEHGFFPSAGFEIRVEQGVEMGRPSLLRLRGKLDQGRREIEVGGRVIPVARGEIY